MLRFVQRRVVKPLLDLLRMGATPERLAWSLAMGVLVGINPVLGTTTVLALAAASAFRLNYVASQIGNHLMYPVQLLLLPVWIAVGSRLFGTPGLKLGRRALMLEVKHHPWQTTKALWTWEWHALVVWALAAAIVMPLLAMALKPILGKMLDRLHHEPVIEK
jgi:uncharacterized protein (DUF2062 family)